MKRGGGGEEAHKSLTEVTVIGLFVDEAHGDVPASSSADARVARPLASQGLPGHPRTLLYHSNSIVRRGSSYKSEGTEGVGSEN